jgi:TM2 domain-containing membrane protein YozV
LGWSGIDRFYLKRYFTGILKLITLGGLGFWWILDIFLILIGQLKEGEEGDLFGL